MSEGSCLRSSKTTARQRFYEHWFILFKQKQSSSMNLVTLYEGFMGRILENELCKTVKRRSRIGHDTNLCSVSKGTLDKARALLPPS